jgi:hypothetical protein
LITQAELESGKPAPGTSKATPSVTAAMSSRFLNRGVPSSREPNVRPHFKVSQRVRARNINPAGHTRLPRYARGKVGIVERDHGVYDFPDTVAHFQGESGSMSTRCASQRASYGVRPPRRGNPFTWICGTTTLSQPDPTLYPSNDAERLAALPRLPPDPGGPSSLSPGRRRPSRRRSDCPNKGISRGKNGHPYLSPS